MCVLSLLLTSPCISSRRFSSAPALSVSIDPCLATAMREAVACSIISLYQLNWINPIVSTRYQQSQRTHTLPSSATPRHASRQNSLPMISEWMKREDEENNPPGYTCIFLLWQSLFWRCIRMTKTEGFCKGRRHVHYRTSMQTYNTQNRTHCTQALLGERRALDERL